ncbi:MAG TPA: DEAD/DEAH box helicase, partial [Rectinemataceae bacterium]
MTFESLGLSPSMLSALAKKGFEEPTPIQALAIPRLLSNGSILAARARTGTGKTAAFGIPLVEILSKPTAPDGKRSVRALVLVPTRELAIQVTEEISSLRWAQDPRLACIYGGASIGEQFRRLAHGVDIVVGTPGRVLDHMSRGSLELSSLEYFILDEADEMLDMGFVDDIRAVMGQMRQEARILLFSATLAPAVLDIIGGSAKGVEILEDASQALPTELADQLWIEVLQRDKLEALCRIIDAQEDFFGIVFVSTKVEADKVATSLAERGYEAEALHGDLSQDARERVLGKFRDKRLSVLVATDVAARGIDIEKLSHVINWSLPHDSESYLHRVGRTGRAGNEGTAITFVTPEEYRLMFRIKRVSGGQLRKATVPLVEEIMATKKARLLARMETRAKELEADEAEFLRWKGLAEELQKGFDPTTALAVALAEGLGDELDPSKYREISEASVDGTGTSRLYLAYGKRDGANPRSVAARIKALSGLSDREVASIEVYENFSFVTVPYKHAERIIDEARKSGGFPAVRKALPRGKPAP